MHTLAILATLEAKAGKEEELSAFLNSALPLAAQETQTLSWFAFRIGPQNLGSSTPFRMKTAGTLTSMAKSQRRYSPRRTSCWLRRLRSRNPTSWLRSERCVLRSLPVEPIGLATRMAFSAKLISVRRHRRLRTTANRRGRGEGACSDIAEASWSRCISTSLRCSRTTPY